MSFREAGNDVTNKGVLNLIFHPVTHVSSRFLSFLSAREYLSPARVYANVYLGIYLIRFSILLFSLRLIDIVITYKFVAFAVIAVQKPDLACAL